MQPSLQSGRRFEEIVYQIQVNYIWKLPASLVTHLVKNLSAMPETLVQFLGQEDPLEKG